MTYQEGDSDTFTHLGREYRINKIFELVENYPIVYLDVEDLKWILMHDHPDVERAKKADINTPILVHKKNNRYYVVDGLHRLYKAVLLSVQKLPCKMVKDEDLRKAAIF